MRTMMTELVHALPFSLSNLAFVCMTPPKFCFRARAHCFTVAVCRPSGGQHGYTHTSQKYVDGATPGEAHGHALGEN